MKPFLKWLASVVAYVLVAPLWLQTLALRAFLRTDQPFQMASHLLSLAPGVVGNYLRRAFYRMTLARCGTDVCIEFGTILHQASIELGRRVYIGCNCSIGAAVIEDDVLIGSNVDILSGTQQHRFHDLDVPIREQGGRLDKILIGRDCWVGNSSVIMANVGPQAVVAAGSVVVNSVEPRSVVGGHPAKPLRTR